MPRDTERSFLTPHVPDAARRGGGAQRNAQVAALVTRVLRDRLARGLNDPRVQGMVSVLSTDVAPDLGSATVRISVLPADRGRLTLSGLRSATRHLEALLRKATRLRRVPRLAFELDDSLKREGAVLQTLAALSGGDAIQQAHTDPTPPEANDTP